MFLVRMAFWVGLVVLLLPSDERQQARFYDTVLATAERVTTFCDRNAQACAAGAELWATFVKKAEFAGRIAVELMSTGGRREEEAVSPRLQPTPAGVRPGAQRLPADRGTLTPADLAPAWRGQARAGT